MFGDFFFLFYFFFLLIIIYIYILVRRDALPCTAERGLFHANNRSCFGYLIQSFQPSMRTGGFLGCHPPHLHSNTRNILTYSSSLSLPSISDSVHHFALMFSRIIMTRELWGAITRVSPAERETLETYLPLVLFQEQSPHPPMLLVQPLICTSCGDGEYADWCGRV